MKNIIAYVGLPYDCVEVVRQYGVQQRSKYRTMLIRDSRKRSDLAYDGDILIECDFSSSEKIARALLPYQDELLAISCRSESHMELFAKIIPHVPYLRTPTTESIEWSTDKLHMRRRLRLYDKKGTPAFTIVSENTKTERKRIAEKIGFPLIIKPANLAQSMLVSVCYHEEEFETTLRKAFQKIQKIYIEKNYDREPTIIAEQFMDGDMYSIDAYVTARGKVYFCPIVKVITRKSLGKDDLSNFMHTTVHSLKKTTVARAEKAAETAIHALGLRSTSAHIELMKVDDEWKIIELGPRPGGFRRELYWYSYGINHSLNDLLIRIPKKPVVPKKRKAYATALKYYPEKEGTITELKGIKKIQALESFKSIKMLKKIGDRSVFAQNGGTAVFSVILANADKSKLLADTRRVEQLVKITVK